MPYLLGIDIGTSGTKTLICDENGTVLATAMAATGARALACRGAVQRP